MKSKKIRQTNKTKPGLIDTENKAVVARRKGGWREGEMGEEAQKVQTSSFKLTSHGDVSTAW